AVCPVERATGRSKQPDAQHRRERGKRQNGSGGEAVLVFVTGSATSRPQASGAFGPVGQSSRRTPPWPDGRCKRQQDQLRVTLTPGPPAYLPSRRARAGRPAVAPWRCRRGTAPPPRCFGPGAPTPGPLADTPARRLAPPRTTRGSVRGPL